MKITDVAKWRNEITLAEQFRDKELGELSKDRKSKAGLNIDYYENGFSDSYFSNNVDMITTVNIVDTLVSIVVPSLYFRNPRTIVLPKRLEDEQQAPIVAKLIDHYRALTNAEQVNRRVIWDAYVLGIGISYMGYTTKFGKNLRDEEAEKEREKNNSFKSRIGSALEAIGLKKKQEEKENLRNDTDINIISESPFIGYISPFDFIVDPRATSIDDAMWWGHCIKKTVKQMKENKKYKNTSSLKGMEPEGLNSDKNVSMTDIEDFEIVYLYEIHYRNEGKFYILYLSKDGSEEWNEHYHEESPYELDEWQVDILDFKKHGHAFYPKSDISKMRNLQDRITDTIDSILEQVNKFVPKVAYKTGGLTEEGKNALENGDIGALVECQDDPDTVFKELAFTQLKADLQALIDQLITLITIQTGITRAQITGVSNSSTATEATIEQGGQNIRMSDMSGQVIRFVNRQSGKLWKIIRQFVDLDDLNLINGVKGIDEETGLPKYEWLIIDSNKSEKLQHGDFQFNIETGSTEKINLAMVRKAFENLFNIVARPDVIGLIQSQGSDVKVAEILRRYFDLFPELGVDSSKIIQKANAGGTNLLAMQQMLGDKRGGTTTGSMNNQMQSQMAEKAPSLTSELNSAY